MSSSPKYPPNQKHLIPASSSVALPLLPNQTLTVLNTHGTQVIDFFAFCSPNPSSIESLTWSHHLSMSHTRASTCHLSPVVGDVLTTTHREPILEVLEDTTSGVHDTLIAACDLWRYRELVSQQRVSEAKGAEVEEGYYHESCADNLIKALIRDMGLESEDVPDGFVTPQPLNLFMNIPIHPNTGVAEQKSPSAGAKLSFERPVCGKGEGVTFKVLTGCVVVMSACPQDMLDINCGVPRECEFVVGEEEGLRVGK